jgi:hypothetical protein
MSDLDKDTIRWLHDHSQKSKDEHRLNGIHVVKTKQGNLATATNGFKIAYVPTEMESGEVITEGKYPVSDRSYPDVSYFLRDYPTVVEVDTSELFYALTRIYNAGLEFCEKGEAAAVLSFEKPDLFDPRGYLRITQNTEANQVIAETGVAITIKGDPCWAVVNVYKLLQALAGWSKQGKSTLHKFGSFREYKPTVSFKRDYDCETTVIGIESFWKPLEINSGNNDRGVVIMPNHLPTGSGIDHRNRQDHIQHVPIELKLKHPSAPQENIKQEPFHFYQPIRRTITDLKTFVKEKQTLPDQYNLTVVYHSQYGWQLLELFNHTSPQLTKLMQTRWDKNDVPYDTMDYSVEAIRSFKVGYAFNSFALPSDSLKIEQARELIRQWLQAVEEGTADLWWSLDCSPYKPSNGVFPDRHVYARVAPSIVQTEQYKALRDAMGWKGLPTSLEAEKKGQINPDRNWVDDNVRGRSPFRNTLYSIDHVKTTIYKWQLVQLQAELEQTGLWPTEHQPYYNPTKNETYAEAEALVLRAYEYTRGELLADLERITPEPFFIGCAYDAQDAARSGDRNTLFKYYKMFQPYLYAWYEEYPTDPVGVLTAMIIVCYWNNS